MKKLLIYIVCIMAGAEMAGAQEVHTIYVHDTIYIERPEAKASPVDSTDIIYTKPIGRFDRGIINYRFIPKRNGWAG